MPLAGKHLLPRDAAAALAVKWPGDELPKAVATMLSESALYVGAYHDNISEGEPTSRDCGAMEINIDWAKVGGPLEDRLRTESLDPAAWEPVLAYNVLCARALYDAPWVRDGKKDIRRWEPWVGYTTGWATFRAWWSWNATTHVWHRTGRYIQQSITGCANYHLLIKKDKTLDEALAYARLQATRFHVEGSLATKTTLGGDTIVYWSYIPPCPTAPPIDGVGPRPKPNDGI